MGCFAARNLMRWKISALLLEARDDVCREITRANTAICYAGYDNKPGSLKAELTVRGNAGFDRLCRELDVPFCRPGSLMVSFGEHGDRVLLKKKKQGDANGVPGLRILSGQEARKMEPMLSDGVTMALYAPTTGTVNPWQLGIAAYENAVHNGCEAKFSCPVIQIRQTEGGYLLETEEEAFFARTVINCAGAQADTLQELLFPPSVRLELDGADFIVLDKHAPKPNYIIFQESETGKGITAVPCVEGNLLLDSPSRPLGAPYASTVEGMQFIRESVKTVLPDVDMTQVIRSFGAVRPNPRRADGRSIPDYCIEQPAPSFFSLIGIKTPGLTCANELGKLVAEKGAAYLHAEENEAFDPVRRNIPRMQDKEIVCQCEQISRGQILEAIRRGARTVDGVKRRVGSGMGVCQGSRCYDRIEQLLEECQNGTL